ncbi:hypothetical protein N9W84_01445 [bacterium]|nr:hypothetical protein [bacterium]
MSKDFSEFAESFFSSYFKNGYVGIKKDNSTALYALNNDDYTEHTHAVSEWIIGRVIKGSVPFMSKEEFLSFENIAMSVVDEKNYKFISYMLYKATRYFNSQEKITILSKKRNTYRILSKKVFPKDKFSIVSCKTIWGNTISFFANKDFCEDIDYLSCDIKVNGRFYNAKNWEVG